MHIYMREMFLPHKRSAYIYARQLALTSVALKVCGFHIEVLSTIQVAPGFL